MNFHNYRDSRSFRNKRTISICFYRLLVSCIESLSFALRREIAWNILPNAQFRTFQVTLTATFLSFIFLYLQIGICTEHNINCVYLIIIVCELIGGVHIIELFISIVK